MDFTPPVTETTRPTLRGSFGMVGSTHWLASQSAMAVLERGGNAFDAAVAGALVLQVVEPHLNGPGSDLVALVAPTGEATQVLMGQGPAPAGASAEAYRELGLDLVPGSGLLAAAVPGAFDAWMLLLRDRGTWEPYDVAEFALHYAERGFPVLPTISKTIGMVAEHFREHWPTSAERWLVDGEAPASGTTLTSPSWAATLRRLLDAAQGETREDRIDAVRREWAEGFVAHAIAEFATTPLRDSSGEDHAGVITVDDLRDWRASWEEPVRTSFRDVEVVKAGAWSSGPTLLQALKILEPFADAELDPSTGRGAHLVLETLKLALADRDAHYGDTDVDLATLLSAEYADQRRQQIQERAFGEVRPGSLDGGDPPRVPHGSGLGSSTATRAAGGGEPTVDRTVAKVVEALADRGPTDVVVAPIAAIVPPITSSIPIVTPEMLGELQGEELDQQGVVDPVTDSLPVVREDESTHAEDETPDAGPHDADGDDHEVVDDLRLSPDGAARGDTCHIDVVDRHGNMVSATPSGGWLQSSPEIPELGFALGTRLQMTWLDEGLPSTLTAGKRPRTTLSPTIVERDGAAWMACGSPGGDQQDQWQLPFLLRVLVGGYTLQQAIDAPNLHTTSVPESFHPRPRTPNGAVVEGRTHKDAIAELILRGHELTVAPDWSLGRLSAVTREPDGSLAAAANPRGAQGYAVGR